MPNYLCRMNLRKVLVGLGCLLIVAGIGIAVLVSRGSDKKVSPVPVPPPPAAVLERVDDLAARVPPGRHVLLRARPEGRVLTTVAARTEFGSPQTLAVAFRKGDWIAVRSTALGNRRVGWVRARPLRLVRRPLLLDVDLSKRELVMRDAHGVERRISVAIGAPDTPTPLGRFYVTDKLRGADFGSYYGCCILALSGRQPHLPEGWSGGDRLAIHGSPTPTWGQAVSNGCLHASEADLRYLMRAVPLGTTVHIHA
jgi:L,D-transpeptidase catalytic domain